jgi:hypothetical protein
MFPQFSRITMEKFVTGTMSECGVVSIEVIDFIRIFVGSLRFCHTLYNKIQSMNLLMDYATYITCQATRYHKL